MNYIEKIIKQLQPRFARPYKDGMELRGVNVDHARDQVQKIIDDNQWPVEIFETDIRVKSISIRQTA